MTGLKHCLCAAAAIALLVAPGFSAAQADAPVARPAVKPGDRWAYHLMDYVNYTVRDTLELRVAFATETGILGVARLKGGDREFDVNWTSDWNTLSSYPGVLIKIHHGVLKFPLLVGAARDFVIQGENTVTGKLYKWDGTAKVVSWEDVSVPAGTFHALRIETNGRLVDAGVSYSAREIIWHVPAVKRWVKRILYVNDKLSTGEELVEFKVQ